MCNHDSTRVQFTFYDVRIINVSVITRAVYTGQ